MVTAKTNPKDIEWSGGKNLISIGVQVFALHLSQSNNLLLSKSSENIEISLEPFNLELIAVSPVTVLAGKSVHFPAIGLVNMLHAGNSSIQSLAYDVFLSSVQIGMKGNSEMRVFASDKPSACKIDGKDVGFEYEDHLVIVQVPWSSPSGLSTIEYLF